MICLMKSLEKITENFSINKLFPSNISAFPGFHSAFFSIYLVCKRHLISIYSAFPNLSQFPDFTLILNQVSKLLIPNLFICSWPDSKFLISNSKFIPIPFLIFNLEFLIKRNPRAPPAIKSLHQINLWLIHNS